MSGDGKFERLGKKITSVLCRKKPIPVGYVSTPLKRCLNIIDLTFLSIGSIIGAGIFILTGSSVRHLAGPAIIISFVIAGIPSIITALCYAEFGARIPKAGSTYDYIYVSLGEFWAALVGWYLVTSQVFTAAAMSHSWASYFDTMLDGWIENNTIESVGTFNTPYLSHYPDFFAAAVVIVLCVIVASGAKTSTLFNNIFAVAKLLVIVFIVCYGFSFANTAYWTDPQYGGFAPFGFAGVMAAAPTAYFAYSGGEQACAAGEEAKNPTRQIVWAMVIAFGVSAVAYILMCTALTLMVPYNQVSVTSSFADAFAQRGAPWAKYVVAIGALSGLTNVLFASIFPVPRYVYAMASDGLLIRWLSVVNKRTKTPVRAILIYGLITLVAILLFDLDTLVNFLSMGGLLCSTLVAASIIILRYTPRTNDPTSRAGQLKMQYCRTMLKNVFGSLSPGSAVTSMVIAEVVLMASCSAALVHAPWASQNSVSFGISMAIVVLTGVVLILIQFLILAFVQNEDKDLWFRVPLVPLLPSISMAMNILMILYLEPWTWVLFGLYLLLGVLNYAVYGYRHSILRRGTSPTLDHVNGVDGLQNTKF